MSEFNAVTTRGVSSKGMKRWVTVLAVALTGSVGAIAFAQGYHHDGYGGPMAGGPGWHAPMMGGSGMGGPMFGGLGGHPMGFMGSPERMGWRVDQMLDGLNASDAQRSKIKQIAQSAAADMTAMREGGRALHQRQRELFSAPTVDAAAVEKVRQQMLAHHDAMSKRMNQAMLDASQVLTPDQRAKLAQRMQQREEQMRERSERWQRGSGASAPGR